MMEKRAQIKIQEMAFVLVAIFIFFGIIFLIFSRMQYAKIAKSAEEVREERTITLLRKITTMPEFSCSKSYSGKDFLCIDKNKIEAFKSEKYNNKEFVEIYKKIFKNILKIEIVKIYPIPQRSQEKEILFDNTQGKNYNSLGTYVLLCEDSQSGYKCDISMMLIAFENVQE